MLTRSLSETERLQEAIRKAKDEKNAKELEAHKKELRDGHKINGKKGK